MKIPARIGLVEDQKLVLALLRDLLQSSGTGDVVMTVATIAEARTAVMRTKPELVILDINLPDGDGIALGVELKQQLPSLKVLLISAECTECTLVRIRESGLNGYIDKNAEPPIVLAAVNHVLTGQTYFQPLTGALRRQSERDGGAYTKILGDAEQALMPLFGMGLSDEEIGAQTHLTPETVKWHRGRITNKLGLKNARELMQYCVKKGFIQTRPDGEMRAVTQLPRRSKDA